MTSSTNLSQEPNYNRQGSDISAFTVSENRPELCLAACGRTTACVAYTFVHGSPSVCWLKNATPPATAANGMTSGMMRGRELNTNGAGQNLYSVATPTVKSCENICARDKSCRAYTFVPKYPIGGVCWIKGAVPPPSAASGYISGVKGGLEPPVFRNGVVYSSIPLNSDADIPNRLPEYCQAPCAAESDCQSWRYRTFRNASGKPSSWYCITSSCR